MNPPRPSTSFAPKLRSIQRAFAGVIMRPLTVNDDMQPVWTDGRTTSEVVEKLIKPNDRLTSFERIEIYNRQYWYRIINSFYEDFPGLRALIGDRKFEKLTVAYLHRYPSSSYTLRDLGSRLEKFLRREPSWGGEVQELALEVARLEWAHIVAFDGDGLPSLGADDLLDSDAATLRLGFQPYITLMACEFPVDDYLLAVKRRVEPQGEASNAMSEQAPVQAVNRVRRPKPRKIWLAVQRLDNAVYYKRLEPEAFAICLGIQKGLTLQAACEKALRGKTPSPDFGQKLQGWFAQWTSFGWFYKFDPKTHESFNSR